MEDSHHLFRYCSLAKAVWDSSSLTVCYDLPGLHSFQSWIQHFILLFYSKDGKRSNRITKFIATLWGIWTARNGKIFQDSEITLAYVKELVNIAIKDHESFTKDVRSECTSVTEESIDPALPPGFNLVQLGRQKTDFAKLVLQVDGSWEKASTRAGIGWVASGPVLFSNNRGGGKFGTATSALQCETWACLEALKWTKSQGYEEVLILSDSALLLENLKDSRGHDISIAWMLDEIRSVAAFFRKCSVIKVMRDQVQLANDIAKNCRSTLSNLIM
ncbi:uncharacterized protein LOC110686253 [Chenopodium quinoa]|uniref:uncharacterized protein LOC110686253 n=1 Tax=Chenopodium quinoa TaxID=63459 RepID=UPI000B777917|nr:uncharacterized protein LOC110686253 [Chenopodium quinoa]